MLVTLLLLASACTGGAGDEVDRSAPTSRYPRGGTLRVASEHYTYDPQISYAAGDWEVMRCCLLRTLFTYNGRPTEEGGAILRPDLASGMGSLSPDGLTWTFTLKPGIHYAPPLEDAIITAADIARALEREGDLAQGYSFYYAVIDGFEAFEAGAVDFDLRRHRCRRADLDRSSHSSIRGSALPVRDARDRSDPGGRGRRPP